LLASQGGLLYGHVVTGVSLHLEGRYRHQSVQAKSFTALQGHWLDRSPMTLNFEIANEYLKQHVAWKGTALVTLRPIAVSARQGVFADQVDALYYEACFEPGRNSDPLSCDVLDVSKLSGLWERRRPLLIDTLGERVAHWIDLSVSDVSSAAIDEYICHEIGHHLGHDIRTKWSGSYFRVNGQLAWPLVFMEELRADLLGLAAAADLLPADRAVAVFAYQLGHRFGLAAEAAITGSPCGALPYLLLSALRDIGLLVANCQTTQLELSAIVAGGLDSLRALGNHALAFIDRSQSADRLDEAIAAATYFGNRINDDELMNIYCIMTTAQVR
jgi:hypothetical protein